MSCTTNGTDTHRQTVPQHSLRVSYLIAPFQHVFLALLHLVVDVQKLDDAVLPDVVGILLGFLPVQRRSQ